MKINKLLSVLLSASVALSLLSVPALAAEDEVVTGTVVETETVTETKSTEGDVIVTGPETEGEGESIPEEDVPTDEAVAEDETTVESETDGEDVEAEAQLLGAAMKVETYPLTITYNYNAGVSYAMAVPESKLVDQVNTSVTVGQDTFVSFENYLEDKENNYTYAVGNVSLRVYGASNGYNPSFKQSEDGVTIYANKTGGRPRLDLTVNLWRPLYLVKFTTEQGGSILESEKDFMMFPPIPKGYDPGSDIYGYSVGDAFPTVSLSANPGYIFDGWYLDGEKVELPETVTGDASYVNGTATYTAKWTPVTDVTVWHYYGADSNPVADTVNGAPEMTLTRDSEMLTDEFIKAFAASKDGYQFMSYEVTGAKEDDSWSDPVCELNGSLDLTAYKSVDIRLIYELPTPVMVEVTTAIDENGSITASGEYEMGSDVTITYAANEGYHVSSVLVDGVSVDITGSVVFESISGNHSVAVTTATDETSGGGNDNGDNSDSGNNGGTDDGGSNNGTPDNGSTDNGSSDNGGGSRPAPDTKPEPPVTPAEPEDEVVIEDEDIPLGDLPMDAEDTTVEIDDGDVPLGDLPEDVTADETVIVEKETVSQDGVTGTVVIVGEHVPMGNLPQTGTLAAPAYSARTLALLTLAASLSAAGLAVVLGRKKDKNA